MPLSYATIPPRTTSLEPGTDVRRAGDEPAGARLRRAEREALVAAQPEHELLHRALVAAEEVLGQRLHECLLEGVGPCLRARLDDQVDVDLEVAGADRRLDPVPVAARVGEGLRHGGFARAVEPEHAALGRDRLRQNPLQRLRLDRPWPEPLQLAGRAGEHDDHAAAGVEHDARRGAGDAERDGAVG